MPKLCENCRKRTENKVISFDTETIIKDKPIKYTGVKAVCSNCGELKYDAETNDKDVENLNNAYFKNRNYQ